MKKQLLLLGMAIASTGVFAQGFQIGVRTGFDFNMTGEAMGTANDVTVTNGVMTASTTKNIYGTLAQGVPATLELAYFFNENVGVQLDAGVLIGLNKNIATADINYEGAVAATSELRLKTKTFQFRVSPQLVLRTNGLYSRFGVMIPLAGSTTVTEESTTNIFANSGGLADESSLTGGNFNETYKFEQKITGKFSLGFVAAVGYEFNLGDNMALFGELEYIGLTIKRNTTEITMMEVDGVDALVGAASADLNDEYVDEINNIENALKPGNERLQLSEKRNYSSLGIHLGLRIKF